MCIRMKTLNGFYRVNIEHLIGVVIVNGFTHAIADVFRTHMIHLD